MTLDYQVLGAPGRDNALFVRVSTGQAIHRLLFDCGEGCLSSLEYAEVRDVDHLFFSHLHMDHIGGFDTFFRATYNQAPKCVWGPPRTGEILHHRLRGFMWNLYEGEPGMWYVHDIHPDAVRRARFAEAEAFAVAHPDGTLPHDDAPLLEDPAYTIRALEMDHHTPSMAYVVREKPRLNVDAGRLAALELPPGPWLKQLKEPLSDEASDVQIAGARHEWAELRRALLTETRGDSIAYLTDFLLDEAARARLAVALRGCDTVVCECQYRDADLDLATRNRHMAAKQVAALARDAGIGKLILFHVSDRYRPHEWLELLAEARAIFPSTFFPAHWGLVATQ
jgi:ribonuclease Z